MDAFDWKIRTFLVDEGYLFPITDAEIQRALKELKQLEMDNFKTRLIDEKAQLDEKIKKLNDFFDSETFKTLPAEQQRLLNIQYMVMGTYSHILFERITLIG